MTSLVDAFIPGRSSSKCFCQASIMLTECSSIRMVIVLGLRIGIRV
jgi:hypothetical protein